MASRSRSITAGMILPPSPLAFSHRHDATDLGPAHPRPRDGIDYVLLRLPATPYLIRCSPDLGRILFCRLYGRAFREPGQGGPGDTGVVVHLGRHHPRARREMGEELLGLLAYATTDDDEIWPEEELDPVEVLIEALG